MRDAHEIDRAVDGLRKELAPALDAEEEAQRARSFTEEGRRMFEERRKWEGVTFPDELAPRSKGGK